MRDKCVILETDKVNSIVMKEKVGFIAVLLLLILGIMGM